MTNLPRITVGLINHSTNSDNLGVGALTVAEIDILREAAQEAGCDLRILVIDWKDTRPAYVHGDDIAVERISSRDIVDPRGLARLYRRCDIVIDIGAGDSFSDIYGQKRLTQMFATKFLCHALRVPMVLAPQTIGPFRVAANRVLARRHLRACKAVFARDELSMQALHTLGLGDRGSLASDLALVLPYDTPVARMPGAPVRVGFNVSGLLMNGGYTRSNMFGLRSDYGALVEGLIDDFRAHDDVELHFVGHVISEYHETEDDHRVGMALAERYPGTVLAPRFGSPSEAKSYIAGMDFFMGARMHATIAAFSSGVPVIPMAYSRKFRGLFGSLGYDRVVDCTSETAEDIRAAVAQAFGERDTVAKEVALALGEGRKRLAAYRDTITRLLQNVPR